MRIREIQGISDRGNIRQKGSVAEGRGATARGGEEGRRWKDGWKTRDITEKMMADMIWLSFQMIL